MTSNHPVLQRHFGHCCCYFASVVMKNVMTRTLFTLVNKKNSMRKGPSLLDVHHYGYNKNLLHPDGCFVCKKMLAKDKMRVWRQWSEHLITLNMKINEWNSNDNGNKDQGLGTVHLRPVPHLHNTYGVNDVYPNTLYLLLLRSRPSTDASDADSSGGADNLLLSAGMDISSSDSSELKGLKEQQPAFSLCDQDDQGPPAPWELSGTARSSC